MKNRLFSLNVLKRFDYKKLMIQLLIMVASVVAIWLSLLSFHIPKLKIKAVSLLPDATMEQITSTRMDTEGQIKLKIIAPKMQYYSKTDSSTWFDPKIYLYRQSNVPWFIQAKFARSIKAIDELRLWDQVNISHAGDDQHPPTHIQTSLLIIHPSTKIISTPALITMRQPNLLIHAVGMQANMNEGSINLLSQTRGEYVPDSPL